MLNKIGEYTPQSLSRLGAHSTNLYENHATNLLHVVLLSLGYATYLLAILSNDSVITKK